MPELMVWNFESPAITAIWCVVSALRMSKTPDCSAKLRRRCVPNSPPVTTLPISRPLCALVTVPRSTRSITESETTPLCSPRPRWPRSASATAAGRVPTPSCTVASSGTSSATRRATAEGSGFGKSMMRVSPSTSRSMSCACTTASPSRRGSAGLSSAKTNRACCSIAGTKSQITPSVKRPSASGHTCTRQTSTRKALLRNKPGSALTCEGKISASADTRRLVPEPFSAWKSKSRASAGCKVSDCVTPNSKVGRRRLGPCATSRSVSASGSPGPCGQAMTSPGRTRSANWS